MKTPAPSSGRGWARYFVPAYAALAGGLLLTALCWLTLTRRHERWGEEQLSRQTTNALNKLQAAVAHRVLFLHGVQGFLSAKPDLKRAEFARFVEAAFGGVADSALVDLGFAPRVQAADWPRFRRQMVAEGLPATHLGEAPTLLDQGECFPVTLFTDTRSRQVVPLGYLLNAESNRLAALRFACDLTEPVATPRVTLFLSDLQHNEDGFLIFLPIYDQAHASLTNVARRREAFSGVVFVSISGRGLLGEVLAEQPGLDFRLYANLGWNPADLVFDSSARATGASPYPPELTPRRSYGMNGLGRQWSVAFYTAPAFEAALGPVRYGWVTAVGAAASFAVFGLLQVQAIGRRRSEVEAERLAASEAALQRRAQALTALAELGQRLGGARQPDEWLEPVLRLLGTAAIADRVYLLLAQDVPELGPCLRPRAEWCAAGIAPKSGVPQSQWLPVCGLPQHWVETFQRGDLISGVRADFPPDEAALLDATGIQSVLALPLQRHGQFAGFIGFELCRTARAWLSEEIELLRGGCTAVSLALERHDAEERFALEAQRLAVTLESIGDAVIATDREGRVQLLNHVAVALTGKTIEAAQGQPLESVLQLVATTPPDSVSDWVRRALVLERPGELPGSRGLPLPDGRVLTVAISVAALRAHDRVVQGAVICLRDITERRRLEEEQLRASKLESIGVLAGGLAHDFNNLLAAMLGNVSLARMLADSPAELLPCLQQTEEAIWRARNLTQQLLTFAKGGAPVARPTSLGPLLRQAVELATHGTPVQPEITLPADLWLAEVDPGQLGQVVQNLVINAVQAMQGSGRVWLVARNVAASDPGHPSVLKGEAVCVTLRDEGPGLSPQAMTRLFDPYFTTKPGGTGLGLATAYNIVRRHGGLLTADSSPGQGACFSIWLPARNQAPAPSVPPAPAAPLALTGRLLVMDDDLAVQRVAVQMARRLGLEVEAAKHGEEAIDLYARARAAGRRFDVVILDLTIVGGLGGLETLARLRQLDPTVVAVVSSGYSTDRVLANFAAEGFRGLLEKPYQAEQLASVLRQVLTSPPPLAAAPAP
jgi:PAS domain S-box-containing protein